MTQPPDRMTPAERKRLAGELQVSPRTVDRVYDAPELVSEETRHKVEAKREELGLGRPPVAIFGLLVPDELNPFFALLRKSIDARLAQTNYHLLSASSYGYEPRALATIHFWLSQKVAGVFYAQNPVFEDSLDALQRAGNVSVVFVDVDPGTGNGLRLPDNSVGTVLADNAAGIERALAHLVIEHDHRRIAFLAGPDTASTARAREIAFDKACSEFDLEPVGLRLKGEYTFESGRTAAIELAKHYRSTPAGSPTAVVVANDLMAIGLIKGLERMGYRVPGDFSVVGFDNIDGCAWTTPELTSIDQRIDEIADRAVRLMTAKRMLGFAEIVTAASARETTDYVQPVLIERKSVGAPRVDG